MKIVKRFAPLFLAIVLVFGSCLSVSAAENTLILPSDFESLGYDCAIVIKGIHYRLYTSDSPLVVCYENGNHHVYFESDTKFIEYRACDSLDFSESSPIENTELPLYTSYSVCGVYSTYDIYYQDSETLFFQGTPPNPIKSVENLPTMIAPQIQTIVIIAVFCLALLIGLVMLRKKLPIFLRL